MSQILHVALDRETYKKSKAGILESEIAILNSMKHLHALRQIQLQQQEVRKKVLAAFEVIKQKMEKIVSTKLPEVKQIPKTNYKKESINMVTRLPNIKNPSPLNQKRRNIEDELTSIQRKLDLLNN